MTEPPNAESPPLLRQHAALLRMPGFAAVAAIKQLRRITGLFRDNFVCPSSHWSARDEAMTAARIGPTLQKSVDRLGRALEVPYRLYLLHPRKQGHPGNYAALAPAITLGVISAFEGFVEDFLATALFLQGHSMGQIAQKVNINNPTVEVFANKIATDFPSIKPKIGRDFSVVIWPPRQTGKQTTWQPTSIHWDRACSDAYGWMQVRHCLVHGLVSGWRGEVWPGPLKGSTPATSVLRPLGMGKHSLGLYGAMTCAQIYLASAEHLAGLVAKQMGRRHKLGNCPCLRRPDRVPRRIVATTCSGLLDQLRRATPPRRSER